MEAKRYHRVNENPVYMIGKIVTVFIGYRVQIGRHYPSLPKKARNITSSHIPKVSIGEERPYCARMKVGQVGLVTTHSNRYMVGCLATLRMHIDPDTHIASIQKGALLKRIRPGCRHSRIAKVYIIKKMNTTFVDA